MKTLACPECHQVMHRVEVVTPQTASVGRSQLARHCTFHHVIPALEAMLAGMADRYLSVNQILALTEILCPGCGLVLREDNGLYVRLGNRTQQVCSQLCLRSFS